MIVMKIGDLGFKRRDDMTVRQYENYKHFLGGEEVREINNGTFKYVIGNTFEEALAKLHRQVAEYVARIGWLQADLADFYFTEWHEEVDEDGLFRLPNSTYSRKYRLSDCTVI